MFLVLTYANAVTFSSDMTRVVTCFYLPISCVLMDLKSSKMHLEILVTRLLIEYLRYNGIFALVNYVLLLLSGNVLH